MAGPTYGKNPPGDVLDFGIVTGQHRLTWDQIDRLWQWAEEGGLDSAWAFDHFMSLRDDGSNDCLEGWMLLGGLAARTRHLQLGLLVTSITHREPLVLAKEAVTVDHISGGRLILGLGAGWNAEEHRIYGLTFPPDGERVGRFGEILELYRLLEQQERTTYHGRYYSLENAPFAPKPVFGRIPVMVGSRGLRMMRFIARFADQWDGKGTPEEYRAHGERLNAICREVGRDPSEIRWGLSSTPWVPGSPEPLESEDAFRRFVVAYAEVGCRSFLFNTLVPEPTTVMRSIVDHVVPELREAFTAGRLREARG